MATCDWGWCDEPSAGWRLWRGAWLPVCADHDPAELELAA